MSRPLILRALAFGAIVLTLVITGWLIIRPDGRLPIFHPKQIDARLVDPAVRSRAGEHHISDFRLMDQRGDTVTLATVAGRIIVADFFFTTCGTICPKMTVQMERVQDAFLGDDRVVILSHSVTPEIDNVDVLAAYAELHGADPERWHMLTGDRAQIYRLARRSYFACLEEGDGGPDDFVHTENFVLVDPQRRIRGFYDGTQQPEVDRLIGDIGKLINEIERGT